MYSEYEIFGTNQQMRKVIEQACERLMETYGLRHVELDILYLISHEKQKDTAKDLIEIQHLSKAHISKSVDNLKQHGYIELVADEADHRKIHIRMTGKAKPVLEEFEPVSYTHLDVYKRQTERLPCVYPFQLRKMDL